MITAGAIFASRFIILAASTPPIPFFVGRAVTPP